MGIFDRLFKWRSNNTETRIAAQSKAQPTSSEDTRFAVIGAKDDRERQDYQTYYNGNITFSSGLTGYDYDNILRNKQSNIVTLYQLADYYCDADPIIHGIIKHVYVPYTQGPSSNGVSWMLSGATAKTRKIYEEYYKQIRLREKLSSII